MSDAGMRGVLAAQTAWSEARSAGEADPPAAALAACEGALKDALERAAMWEAACNYLRAAAGSR